MVEFLLKLLVSAAFAVLLWGGLALYMHPLPLWACLPFGVVVVFAGVWALDGRGRRRRRRWVR